MKIFKYCILFLMLNSTLDASAQLYISSGTEFYIAPSEQFTTSEQVNNSGTLTIAAGATATLNGGATGTGVIKGSATSNLIIGGTSTTGTYYFDQTTPGTTNVMKNLTLAGSTTATLGNNINITAGANAGTVLLGTGTTLNSDGKLIIKSNATGAARVANSSGTISGDVVVERYIPATRRAYRFLAAPVTTTGGIYANWQESGINASGLGIQITGVVGAAPGGVDATTGLDKTTSGNASMFSYDGSAWVAVTNTKSTQLTPGAGFRVLVRGDRTTDLYAASNPAATATTIKATGAVGQGTITLNSLATGFNLLGNPYPSSIDWNASGWGTARNNTNVYDAIYIYDPSTTASTTSMTYPTYVNGVATNGGSNIIRSGQAFFVEAAASASISFLEAYKSDVVDGGFFKSAPQELMRVTYLQNNTHLDDIVIRYNDDAQPSFDPSFDARSMGGELNGLASIKQADRLAIHTRPINQADDSIALSVRSNTTGNFQLKFSELESFTAGTDVMLHDKFLNLAYNVKQDSLVDFEITADVNTKGDDRFWLFINHKSTGINQQLGKKEYLSIYPNPAASKINLALKMIKNQKTIYEFAIYNQLGSIVSAGSVDFAQLSNPQINVESLTPGVYFIKASNGFDVQSSKFIK